MFSQPHIRSAILSTLAVLLVLSASVNAPGAGASPVTSASSARAAAPTAAPAQIASNAPAAATATPDPAQVACANMTTPTPPFSAADFPNPPLSDNTFYTLVPGTQFIMEGRANLGGGTLDHQVIFTVTDLVKVINGVRTFVLWDRDINGGVLREAELAFHAQDNAKNVWVLGEYPAEYTAGQFTGAPSTWITGLSNAQGGTLVPGDPKLNSAMFLQAYAPPDVIHDCGQVSTMGTQVCNSIGCYDNVLVINEVSPQDPPGSVQQKFYAPGVGNFQIGAINDPQGETLVLKQKVQLSVDACIAARNAALALEDQAYNHDTSQTVYDQTAPMEQTNKCENPPTATPTTTPPTETVTPTPPTETVTPTPPTETVTPTPTGDLIVYLSMISHIDAQFVPPAIYDGCKSDPNPAGATNFPVRIVSVDKVAEIVTIENVSNATVSLEDWNMCSLSTNLDHDQIFGTIAPGQTRSFPNIGDPNVWINNQRNDGALYNAAGFLVSYWVDQ